MTMPWTERGHLYVKVASGLKSHRVIFGVSQELEAKTVAQLDELWNGMDDAERARVELALEGKRPSC
jgi:hypothetical protein